MKVYPVVDLTSDAYLNPPGDIWTDGEGSHQRSVGEITSISVHHDAVDRSHDYDSVARMHTEAAEHYVRLGNGLQYHDVIDNQGTIYHVRPDNLWLNVVGSSENRTTYAIKLDGNFETQQPTREQLEALFQRLLQLCTQRPDFPATWPNVRPHADFSATACCGLNLRNRIYAIQDESTAQAQLLNQGEFDWPSMQPGYVPPAPPVNPAPPAPHPAPAPTPVTVPVTPNPIPPAAVPVTVTAPALPEYEETFVPFPEFEDVLLKADTAAIDMTGDKAPIHLVASKPYGSGAPFKSSGTFTDGGNEYYRGTSGGWYGVPAIDVASSVAVKPPAPTTTPGWSTFLKDPLGWLIRLFSRKTV